MPRISVILLCFIKPTEGKKPNPQLFLKQRGIQKWQLCSFQMSLCSTKYFSIIRVLYFNYFISYLIWKPTNQYNSIIFMPRENPNKNKAKTFQIRQKKLPEETPSIQNKNPLSSSFTHSFWISPGKEIKQSGRTGQCADRNKVQWHRVALTCSSNDSGKQVWKV